MASIITNAAAMTALQSLTMTNKALEQAQGRISTGLKVAQASDNAAYWSIATTMRSDNKSLTTVQDALGLGAAKLDVTYTAVNSAIKVADEIKAKLVAARESGVDRNKIQSEITSLQNQLVNNATAASFSGENWLSVDSSATTYNAMKSIVSSFARAADGTVGVSTIQIDTATVKLFDAKADTNGILDSKRGAAGTIASATDQTDANTADFTVTTLNIAVLTSSVTDIATIDSYINGVDDAIKAMTTAASDLGAYKKRVDIQKDFVASLIDTIDRGIGQLVDADMNVESSRLKALQVQQQLGIQALSIANSTSQGLLQLFQG